MRKYGIQSNQPEAPTVEPDKVSHPKGGYSVAVMSEDQCHAHPYGTSLKVDGVWYWRDQRANLLSLLYCNSSVIPGMHCRCPVANG